MKISNVNMSWFITIANIKTIIEKIQRDRRILIFSKKNLHKFQNLHNNFVFNLIIIMSPQILTHQITTYIIYSALLYKHSLPLWRGYFDLNSVAYFAENNDLTVPHTLIFSLFDIIFFLDL